MLLQTDTKPRTNGTLTVRDAQGEPILFTQDADGVLTGEVKCPATLKQLLRSGNFYPAEEADLRAAKLALKTSGKALADQLDGMDELEDDGEEGDEGDEDGPEGDGEALPPGAKPKRRSKKAAA